MYKKNNSIWLLYPGMCTITMEVV